MDKEINISEMTTEYAHLISSWTYDGIYSIYNHREEFVNECMDEMHFAFTSVDGELLGYFCFGGEARIPTIEENVYDGDFLDVGLHIRPDLCGKKLGGSFLSACLDYAQEKFNTNCFRATIASFNERSIKLFIRVGFYSDRIITHLITKNKFVIVKRDV